MGYGSWRSNGKSFWKNGARLRNSPDSATDYCCCRCQSCIKTACLSFSGVTLVQQPDPNYHKTFPFAFADEQLPTNEMFFAGPGSFDHTFGIDTSEITTENIGKGGCLLFRTYCSIDEITRRHYHVAADDSNSDSPINANIGVYLQVQRYERDRVAGQKRQFYRTLNVYVVVLGAVALGRYGTGIDSSSGEDSSYAAEPLQYTSYTIFAGKTAFNGCDQEYTLENDLKSWQKPDDGSQDPHGPGAIQDLVVDGDGRRAITREGTYAFAIGFGGSVTVKLNGSACGGAEPHGYQWPVLCDGTGGDSSGQSSQDSSSSDDSSSNDSSSNDSSSNENSSSTDSSHGDSSDGSGGSHGGGGGSHPSGNSDDSSHDSDSTPGSGDNGSGSTPSGGSDHSSDDSSDEAAPCCNIRGVWYAFAHATDTFSTSTLQINATDAPCVFSYYVTEGENVGLTGTLTITPTTVTDTRGTFTRVGTINTSCDTLDWGDVWRRDGGGGASKCVCAGCDIAGGTWNYVVAGTVAGTLSIASGGTDDDDTVLCRYAINDGPRAGETGTVACNTDNTVTLTSADATQIHTGTVTCGGASNAAEIMFDDSNYWYRGTTSV